MLMLRTCVAAVRPTLAAFAAFAASAAFAAAGAAPDDARPPSVAAAARQALLAKLGTSSTRRLEIDVETPDAAIPAGARLRARPVPDSIPASRVVVWVDVFTAGRFERSIPVAARVKAYEPAWVARQDLRPGQAPAPASVERTEIDIAAAGVVPWDGDIQRVRIRRTVLAGRAISAADVEAAPPVSRGDRVVLLSTFGAVQVQAGATALQQGELGQVVRVKIDAAQALVRGRVTRAGVVELEP